MNKRCKAVLMMALGISILVPGAVKAAPALAGPTALTASRATEAQPDVEMRTLLNHTSGLFDYSADPALWAGVQENRVFGPKELVAVAAAHPVLFPPGSIRTPTTSSPACSSRPLPVTAWAGSCGNGSSSLWVSATPRSRLQAFDLALCGQRGG